MKGGKPLNHAAALIIAHGSPQPEWNEMVEQAVRQAGLPLPFRTAFLGHVPECSIPLSLAELERSGCNTVIAVPLFVSGGSNHIQDIRHILGINKDLKTRLIWCDPMDDAEQAKRLWSIRLSEITKDPANEALLVVGHGSDLPDCRKRWEKLLRNAASHLRQTHGLREAAHATLLPDTVAQTARKLAGQGRLLVLPLFLAEGYYTQTGIPKRLDGIDHVYTGKVYLPHPLVSDWIRQTVLQLIEGVEQHVSDIPGFEK